MSYALTIPKDKALWKEISLIVGCSLLLGLLGKVMIPLPFTPVPLALRSQLVLLMAVVLGPRRAVLAVLGFLVQGAVGMPVFTNGSAGLGAMIGPNGGYLVGYVAAAMAAGWLAKRSLGLALLAGTAVIYLFGAAYLSTFVGAQNALMMGVVPFLIGDALKIALNWKIARSIREFF